MNSLIIYTGEINVKEVEVSIAYSTRERLEMRRKILVGMLEEWALPGSHGRGLEFNSYRVVAYSNDVCHSVWYLDSLTRRNECTTIVRNVRDCSPNDKASYPRRTESSVASQSLPRISHGTFEGFAFCSRRSRHTQRLFLELHSSELLRNK
jgi:hypothetical protein